MTREQIESLRMQLGFAGSVSPDIVAALLDHIDEQDRRIAALQQAPQQYVLPICQTCGQVILPTGQVARIENPLTGVRKDEPLFSCGCGQLIRSGHFFSKL